MKYKEIVTEIDVMAGFSGNPASIVSQLNGPLMSKESFGDVYVQIFPNKEQAFYVKDKNKIVSYLVLLPTAGGDYWAKQSWTDPKYRRKDISSGLIKYAASKRGRLIMDLNMTADSILQIEKMIADKKIRGSVFDMTTGQATTYNPDDPNDQAIPMYDKPIQGINRPVLAPADSQNFTWVLENVQPRCGILTQYFFEMRDWKKL